MSNVSMINGHIDNVLSDEQIVKALEDTIHRVRNADTFIVPKEGIKNLCNGLEVVVDLINRLKADKEALIKGQESLMKCIAKKKETIAELDAEIERLHKEGLQLNRIFMDFVNMKKSEAIKEFAERLKQEADSFGSLMFGAVAVDDIDNLVKEMTEGDSYDKAFWEDTN